MAATWIFPGHFTPLGIFLSKTDYLTAAPSPMMVCVCPLCPVNAYFANDDSTAHYHITTPFRHNYQLHVQ